MLNTWSKCYWRSFVFLWAFVATPIETRIPNFTLCFQLFLSTVTKDIYVTVPCASTDLSRRCNLMSERSGWKLKAYSAENGLHIQWFSSGKNKKMRRCFIGDATRHDVEVLVADQQPTFRDLHVVGRFESESSFIACLLETSKCKSGLTQKC